MKTPLTLSFSETVEKLRGLTVKERLSLIPVTDQIYAGVQREKDKGDLHYSLDIRILDSIEFPDALFKNINITLILSIVRHGIRPRKHIGGAEILDYVSTNYSSIDQFKSSEPILIDVLKKRDLLDDMLTSLSEVFLNNTTEGSQDSLIEFDND